jgi:HSP20 family molecular chaperone IbpA
MTKVMHNNNAKRSLRKVDTPHTLLRHVGDDIDDLFNHFFSTFLNRRFLNKQGSVVVPKMDMEDKGNEYKMLVDMPGFKDETIDVSIDNDTLTIKGEQKHEEKKESKNYLFAERSYGSFQRSIRLPGNVDSEKIKADLKDGVLRITVPKRPGATERKKISIKSS